MKALLVLLLLSGLVRAEEPQPERHTAGWYASWSLIVGGGAVTLTGAALAGRDAGAHELTAANQAGWALAGLGTAVWIAGAVVMKLSDRKPKR
jgi:hypothetical protein